MSKYIDFFMRLYCAGDVLNSVAPMKKPKQEISKAVGLMRKIRPTVLADPNNINLIHITDGNALASVFMAHILPLKEVHVCNHNTQNEFNERIENITWHKGLPNKLEPNDLLLVTGNVDYRKIMDLYWREDTYDIIMLPNYWSMQYRQMNEKLFDVCMNSQLSKYAALYTDLENSRSYVDENIIGSDNIIIHNLER